MKACDKGHLNVVELLLKYKADVNLQDKVSVEAKRKGGRRGMRESNSCN